MGYDRPRTDELDVDGGERRGAHGERVHEVAETEVDLGVVGRPQVAARHPRKTRQDDREEVVHC